MGNNFEIATRSLFGTSRSTATGLPARASPKIGARFQAGFTHAPIDTPRIIKKWSRLRLSRAQGADLPESTSTKSHE
jgi:hypothetical protein